MSDEPNTVGELLDRLPAVESTPPKARLDVGAHPPGIYFGMPEDEYHRDRSLSASGVKDIHVTPLTFWMKSRFNPARADETTEPKERGKAFHARLLEGAAAFSERYAVAPQIDDYPDALDGGDALKERCKELGIPVSGTIAKLCERIREADPDAVLWAEIMADFQKKAEAEGKIIIKAKLAEEIQRHVRIIEMHPSTEKALRGGYCEVSIFWVDPETGVPMKARIDYLKSRAAVEMKTFSNPFGKPIDVAVASNAANNKYLVDAVVRLDAVETAKTMFRKHGKSIVHGDAPPDSWLDAFAEPGAHRFVFLFLEAGDVPNVRVREFKQRETAKGEQNAYWIKGRDMYREGVALYRKCLEHYGPDLPWVAPDPMRAFVDHDFPLYALE